MGNVVNVAVIYMDNIRFKMRTYYLKLCKSLQSFESG